MDQLQVRLDKFEEESSSKDRDRRRSRSNNVEIKDVPHKSNENLFDIISKIGTKINYPVTKSQINFITRVPTREKEHNKPIIVSFCNRYVKEDFIAAARLAFKTQHLTASQIGFTTNKKI